MYFQWKRKPPNFIRRSSLDLQFHLPLRKYVPLHTQLLKERSHFLGIDRRDVPDLVRESRKQRAHQHGPVACPARIGFYQHRTNGYMLHFGITDQTISIVQTKRTRRRRMMRDRNPRKLPGQILQTMICNLPSQFMDVNFLQLIL